MVYLAADPLTKKRPRIQGKLFDTEDAAYEAAVLAKASAEASGGKPASPATITVEQFFKEWLASVEDTVKRTTYANYRDNIDAYIVPNIGHHRLTEVGVKTLNALYRHLLEQGRRKPDNNFSMYQHWKARQSERGGLGPTPTEIAAACGTSIHAAKKAVVRYRNGRATEPKPKGLERKSVKNIHNLISQALVDAIGWGYLTANPAINAKLPRESARHKKAKRVTWTMEQLAAWLRVAMKDRFGGMWVLAATTGMRRSELAGVERALLDLEKGQLDMHDTRVVVDGQAEDSDGKSDAGWRTVSLDSFTVDELTAYLQMIGKEREGFEGAYPSHGKIMVWPDGRRIHPDTVTRRFNRLVDIAGVPRIRLHDIRHVYVTLSRDRGVNRKILSTRAGHANETVTDTIYTHETPGADREIADTMGDAIKRAVMAGG